jgi:acyl-coenzyme A thioesterase PaaI-like protein
MQTTASLLRAGVETHDGALRLTLDPRFQGLPDTAHGGSVLGALDVIAGLAGAREIRGVYRRRVPLGVPLSLTLTRVDAWTYALANETGVVVEGEIARTATDAATPPPPPASPAGVGTPLPVSRSCFACGTDNVIGLGLRLAHDVETVHGRFVPDARFREADGPVSTVAITTLLVEAAFWLGALATGESGMTTDLRVTLHRPAQAPLRVVGRHADVAPLPGDDRYSLTRLVATDDAGKLVASAAITFVAVRGAARRLVAGLLATNAVDVLHAVFPRYVATA